MEFGLGLAAGFGLGLAGGILLCVRLIPGLLGAVEKTVAAVAESVRFPGSRQEVIQPSEPEAQKLFADLGMDEPAAPAWMLDDS